MPCGPRPLNHSEPARARGISSAALGPVTGQVDVLHSLLRAIAAGTAPA